VPAHLALVNSSGEVRPELPSIDQFDHMVVVVPPLPNDPASANAAPMVLDCTSKNSYALLQPPIWLADKQLLVLDPKKPRLEKTIKFPADAARFTSRRKIVRAAPDGTSDAIRTEVEEQVTFNEYIAGGIRGYLRSFPPAERDKAVQNFFAGSSGLRLESATIDELHSLDKPLTLKLKYAMPEAFHTVGSTDTGATLVGRIPSPWETYFFDSEFVQRRQSPFEFKMPIRVESTIELKLPSGFDLKDVSTLTGSQQSPFVAWATRVKREGEIMKLEYRARRPAGLHPADKYAAYYSEMKNALRVFERPLTLQAASSGAAK
jgi:hypothetical protein